MKALNFGCGNRIHADWINIDFSPIDNRVQKVNLLQPLPFGDNTFDVAYSSHFLEHLTPQNATKVLNQIHRILKSGGTFRIVVPDFENLCRAYLDTLETLVGGPLDSKGTQHNPASTR